MKRGKPNFRCVALLLAMLICMCLIPASVFAGNDVLTVGVPVDRCPVFYIDQNTGKIVGIGADLLRASAEEAGYSVELKAIEQGKSLKDALDNPDYDLVLPFGSALSSTSGKASVISDNLFQTPFTLVTTGKGEIPPLNTIRVGMLKSLSAGAETVRELYPGIQIYFYNDTDGCVKALRKGEVDALLHNSYVWSYVLQKPSYSDLAVQPSTMFSMDFRAGAVDSPKSREIISRLNEGIARIPDTRRQAIILDYTTRNLYSYDLSDYLYRYGMIIVLGMLLLIAVVVIIVMKYHTVRHEQEERIRHMIDYDQLTGALSLTGFRKKAEELLRKNPDRPYILTYVNFKNFKYINESLGRDAGDDLLKYYADITKSSLKDYETFCRIGADHFAVLSCADSDEVLSGKDENIIEQVRNFFINRGKDNRVQVNGGIYFLTALDYLKPDIDRMLDCARVAESKVAYAQQQNYVFYNPEQWEKGKQTADVIDHLPSALKAGDFKVWYQPQVDYESGLIDGAEALCRWNHSKLGFMQPAEFITTLEDANLIFDLDSYVWDKVASDLKRWNDMGLRRCVSVNVSRCDFLNNRDIPLHFRNLVQSYGLSPDQLRIEITETAYVENPDLLILTTKKLQEYGFKVEMDDFGSGYSSLHMLKEVPVDRIKLDMRFLTDSGETQKGQIILSQIITMIKALGMDIIAEGVETKEQAEFLAGQGSSEMQGYYFYRPMPADEFEELITGNK